MNTEKLSALSDEIVADENVSCVAASSNPEFTMLQFRVDVNIQDIITLEKLSFLANRIIMVIVKYGYITTSVKYDLFAWTITFNCIASGLR